MVPVRFLAQELPHAVDTAKKKKKKKSERFTMYLSIDVR